jgi:hypothetical protein
MKTPNKLIPGRMYNVVGTTNPKRKQAGKTNGFIEKGDAMGVDFLLELRFLGIEANDRDNDFYLFSCEWEEDGQQVARIERFGEQTMRQATITEV